MPPGTKNYGFSKKKKKTKKIISKFAPCKIVFTGFFFAYFHFSLPFPGTFTMGRELAFHDNRLGKGEELPLPWDLQ